MNCKHRWEPRHHVLNNFPPNHYVYKCARCEKVIGTVLRALK